MLLFNGRRGRRVGIPLAVAVISVSVGLGSAARSAEPAASNDEAALRDYLSANGLLNRGLYELAVAEYRKFLTSHPTHEKAPVARYGLAVGLFRLGTLDQALGELESLQDRPDFPFGPDVWMLTGQCHFARQQFASAHDAFQGMLARFPTHALADDAALGAVESLYSSSRFEEAAAQCRDFVSRFADSPFRERVLYFWGLSEAQRGDPTAAAERFEELLLSPHGNEFAEPAALLLAQAHQRGRQGDRAVAEYQSIVKQGGKFVADALAGLGALFYERGELDASAAALDRLAREFPENARAPEIRLQRAHLWFDKGQYKEALSLFAELSGGPQSDEAVYWAAKCELRLDDPGAAVKRLAEAVARYPKSPLLAEMQFDQAVAQYRAGDVDGASRTLQVFRTQFPDHSLDAEALRLLAGMEHQRNDFSRSEEFCAELLKKHPEHSAACEIRFLSAENALLSGDSDRAITAYRGFLTAFPGDAQATTAKLRLGLSLHNAQRDEEAVPLLSELVDLAGREKSFCSVFLALGDISFARQAWKTAEQQLSQYLACDATQSADETILKVGIAQQRQERFADAIETYDRLLLTGSVTTDLGLHATFERAQCLSALDRTDEAVRGFEAVVASQTESSLKTHALHQLASIAERQGRSADAAVLYGRAAETDAEGPLGAESLFQQTLAQMNAMRFDDAEKTLRQFVGRFPAHAKSSEARAQLGVALARQDRYEEALDILNSTSQEASNGLPPMLQSAVTYERAWCMRRVGRTSDAADAFKTLLEGSQVGNYDLHALLELAELDIEQDRITEAAAYLRRLQRAISLRAGSTFDELSANCLYRLARCEFQLENFTACSSLLEDFLASFPRHALVPSARFYCGDAYGKTGHHEQAVRHFTAIVKDHKEDPVFPTALLRLGDTLAGLQRWALSEQTFATYLGRFPEDGPSYQAYFGRGWAMENQGRFGEAVKSYDQAIARHQGPTAARAQFQIGQCLFAEQRFDEAVRELLKVDILYAYPEWSAAALFEAGRCFERLGKPGEARKQFEDVQQKHAQSNWAKMAAERLSALSSAAALPGH